MKMKESDPTRQEPALSQANVAIGRAGVEPLHNYCIVWYNFWLICCVQALNIQMVWSAPAVPCVPAMCRNLFLTCDVLAVTDRFC